MNFAALFGIAALGLMGGILWFVWRLVRSPLPLEMQQALEKKEEAKMEALEQKISSRVTDTIRLALVQFQGQIQTTDKSVGQKMEEVNRTLSRVNEQFGELKQATAQIEAVGRTAASLQDLLRAPKMRGGFGEFFLADLIAQIMPSDFYTLQYEFLDGEKVDAAIRLQGKLVPVDSKFPLDQFRRMGQAVTEEERAQWRKLLVRDVKQHIDSIAEKYIRPSEGTFEFALMYIPAENVYYEAIIKEDGASDSQGLFQHAIKKQVIPVSPNSFYAYLQVILLGLKGLAVERRAQEILSSLSRLQKELGGVREDFDLTGKQLRYALTNFEKAERHLGRFEDRLGSAVDGPESKAALPAPSEESMKEA
ncbi:MAG: DNA recombination protein RmuC [Candidatus Omnitrophica bacterium]|nr:DNA recombination protein RmuC [Candidatus Omnitrophota bacterium]